MSTLRFKTEIRPDNKTVRITMDRPEKFDAKEGQLTCKLTKEGIVNKPKKSEERKSRRKSKKKGSDVIDLDKEKEERKDRVLDFQEIRAILRSKRIKNVQKGPFADSKGELEALREELDELLGESKQLAKEIELLREVLDPRFKWEDEGQDPAGNMLFVMKPTSIEGQKSIGGIRFIYDPRPDRSRYLHTIMTPGKILRQPYAQPPRFNVDCQEILFKQELAFLATALLRLNGRDAHPVEFEGPDEPDYGVGIFENNRSFVTFSPMNAKHPTFNNITIFSDYAAYSEIVRLSALNMRRRIKGAQNLVIETSNLKLFEPLPKMLADRRERLELALKAWPANPALKDALADVDSDFIDTELSKLLVQVDKAGGVKGWIRRRKGIPQDEVVARFRQFTDALFELFRKYGRDSGILNDMGKAINISIPQVFMGKGLSRRSAKKILDYHNRDIPGLETEEG